ncbi:hypothetical protein Val02_35320 [Virgisporangium aliadipatigenens]|uniref:Uncharacterized protein n=1 Tax=Virgisporangium aliadipatigenens TaxID=741659 RepID=A0A8J4DR30_9ACTN|nr:hypothetical protein [Virgisporangium aliadipatigenens]GIJ46646.1 hypothetical protein Val02_35320 [Virgisporangium aliadipatigenens]
MIRSAVASRTAGTDPNGAGHWRLWLPPLAAYLLSHLIQAVAEYRSGFAYFTVDGRARFDSQLYLEIAEHGYTLVRCGDIGLGHETGPDSWCGTAGWFPLYPALIRVVATLSPFDLPQAALVVTEAATVAMFGLFWWLLLRLPGGGPVTRGALLVALAAMPAATYFHAVFPMSVAVAAALAHVALLHAGRPLAAGLVGAVAAAAYPIGGGIVVIGLVLAGTAPARNARTLLAGALPALGTLGVFATHAVTVGRWDAYFLVQDRYRARGDGSDPGHNLLTLLRDAPPVPYSPDPAPAHQIERWQQVAPAEMAFALALTLLVTAVAVLPVLRRRRPDPLDAGLALYTLAIFVTPLLIGTQISQYRAHLLLAPGLLVLRRLPAVAGCGLALVMLPLSYVMGTMFGPRILF